MLRFLVWISRNRIAYTFTPDGRIEILWRYVKFVPNSWISLNGRCVRYNKPFTFYRRFYRV